MRIAAGPRCINWAVNEDTDRIKQADQRALETTKEARIAKKRAREDREKELQDDSYVPGGH